jgi:hypothetical protein
MTFSPVMHDSELLLVDDVMHRIERDLDLEETRLGS